MKAPKKTQSKHFNLSSIAKQENPETVLTDFFQDLYSIPADQEDIAQSGRSHWVGLWKNLRKDCEGGVLIPTEETGESTEQTEKRSPAQITADVIAPGMSGKAGEIVVVDLLGHEFSGGMAVLFDCYGSESGGCNVFDRVQADRWIVRDAKNPGLLWLNSLPPLRYEGVQTALVPKTHADAGLLLLLLQAAELSREWQRAVVVVQLDVKKAFDHVDHRTAFKAMRLQGVSPFSMIWNGSCIKARLGTVLSNKVRMSRGVPQGAPESPVIFTMIVELVL